MSDDIRPGSVLSAAGVTPAGVVDHWCEHPGCTNWGGWGYSKGRNLPSTWYCFEHREAGERMLGRVSQP